MPNESTGRGSMPPLSIDGYRVARKRETIEGRIEGDRFSRLAELGLSVGDLTYRIDGFLQAEEYPSLRVAARCAVQGTCPNCLETVSLPLEVETELRLSPDERSIAEAEDDIDRVVGADVMDLVALVEDELILAVPMYPRHEQCASPTSSEVGGDRTSALRQLLSARLGTKMGD